MRVNLVGLVALWLVACAAEQPGASKTNDPAGAKRIETVEVDGAAISALAPPSCGESGTESVGALLGYMEGDEPGTLVVFAHGYGQTVELAWRHHVERTVRPGVAVVTTDYRDNLGFPTLQGAHDTIAATLLAKQRFESIESVILLGVSMGGAISGTAIPESTHVTGDGSSLFDFWINVEGVSQLAETWAEASAVGSPAADDIARDAGGTPADCPEAYVRRAPVERAWEMSLAGLKAAAVVHGMNDGTVPSNQGREMAQALAAAAIPTQMFSVLRPAEGQSAGTTGTGALGLGAVDDFLLISGHGWEGDENHPVIRTGFEVLEGLLDGSYDAAQLYAEHVVDDG